MAAAVVDSPKPPERWLAAYDKNKNGRFDGAEWDTARSTEIKMSPPVDASKNGKIDRRRQRLVENLKKNNYTPTTITFARLSLACAVSVPAARKGSPVALEGVRHQR